MTKEVREQAWGIAGAGGWISIQPLVESLYPMPGHGDFDNDASFVSLAIFPGEDGGKPVMAGDEVWPLPKAWFPKLRVRPSAYGRLRFALKAQGGSEALRRSCQLAVQKAMYLEIFKSRKPISVSTMRLRLRGYMAFADYAVSIGKDIRDLDYEDLANAILSLNRTDRRNLKNIYELLRFWNARVKGGPSYRMFQPPPTMRAVERANLRTSDGSEPVLHAGLDVDRVRGERVEAEAGRTYQPFPDEFVAAAGEFCIKVLDELRPVVNEYYRRIMVYPEDERRSAMLSVATELTWPEFFKIKNAKSMKKAAQLCQIATIFIFSLLLGARWSEVSSLSVKVLKTITMGGVKMRFVDGDEFKGEQSFSGASRDWPITDQLAEYIQAQIDYVHLTEGKEFPHLWRQHTFPWSGREPLKQIDASLKAFPVDHGFTHLLGGSNCHHHRFRKTTARLIVIALHGGPMVLRRLFGHQHLGITIKYILANSTLVEELREIAAAEQEAITARHVEARDDLRGGGADTFRSMIENIKEHMDIYVPEGRKDQEKVTTGDILNLALDGPGSVVIKQIIPGLVSCFKRHEAKGFCADQNDMPNIARCDAGCRWHLEMPEFIGQARINVDDALAHLVGAAPGGMKWRYYSDVVRSRASFFPELHAEFSANPIFVAILEEFDAE